MFSVEQLQRATKAARNGKKDGAVEIPNSSATPFSNTERTIITSCEARIREAETGYVKEVEALRAKINTLNQAASLNTSFEADRTAAQVRQLIGEEETDFRTAIEEEFRQRVNLETFKQENHRSLEPIYSVSPVKTVGILMTLMVAEAGPNALFFAKANDFGLLGGFFIALMISMINVFVGFFSGSTAFRYNKHVHTGHRFWSVPVSAAAIAGAIKFNLTVGAFRDTIEKSKPSQFSEQLYEFASNLVSFSMNAGEIKMTPQSVTLIVFGLVVFFASLMKGIFERDAYPGYAKRDVEHRLAQAAVDDKEDVIRRAVGQTIGQFTDRVGVAAGTLTGLEPALLSAKQSIETKLESLRQDKLHIERVCNAVIHIYRNENLASRKTPKPAYFAEDVKLVMPYDCTVLASVVAALRDLPQRARPGPAHGKPEAQTLEAFANHQYDYLGAQFKRIRAEGESRVMSMLTQVKSAGGAIHAETSVH